jgi:orotidine-5'-phosphate decarboxylase
MQDVTARLKEMLESDDDFEQTFSEIADGIGRGPTGRLRNFKAMNDIKLEMVARDIMYENSDVEAMEAVVAEMERRRYS